MPRSADPGDPAGRRAPFSPRARDARRARAARTGAPYLFPIALAVVAAALLWRYWDRIAGADLAISAAPPEAQIREALRHQERARLEDVYGFRAGGTAELAPVRYADVAVSVEGDEARVLAVVQAEGRVIWRDQQASLSYVGREGFSMRRCSIALWCADGTQFTHLRSVLRALFRRADAFDARDLQAYGRLAAEGYAAPGGREALLARLGRELAAAPDSRVRVVGWQVRVERDRAEVGEDQEVRVGDRPPERRRARYTLARRDDRWLFVDGL